MVRRRAWVLNLDADVELGTRGPYVLSPRVRRAMEPHVARLAMTLLSPGDLLVDGRTPAGSAKGLTGKAFCPTQRAVDVLLRAGAEPEAHPSMEVLRCVNSRAFASSLGVTLPGAAFVTDLDAARERLLGTPVVGDGWRVKYAFGMTGRNQRVVRRPCIDDEEARFLVAGLAQGGVQIEPNVAIDRELALHGMLRADGGFDLGQLVWQRCDARGAWVSSERVVAPVEGARMREELRVVAVALHGAGYFGPFGVDAYVYRGPDGALAFQPRSEINARYSMGFATGFGN